MVLEGVEVRLEEMENDFVTREFSNVGESVTLGRDREGDPAVDIVILLKRDPE